MAHSLRNNPFIHHLVGSAMTLRDVTLTGQHVLLEPLRVRHAQELWPAAREEGLFEYLAPGTDTSLESLQQWIQRRMAEQKLDVNQSFVMRDARSRKAIGSSSYMNVDTRHKRVEIGNTWIGRSHRRTPVHTEAKLLMLEHAFDDWGAVRVQFKCDVRNERAKEALERIGAYREGTMRNERILTDGTIRDAAVYSITDREWREVKSRLQRFLYLRHDVPVGTVDSA